MISMLGTAMKWRKENKYLTTDQLVGIVRQNDR